MLLESKHECITSTSINNDNNVPVQVGARWHVASFRRVGRSAYSQASLIRITATGSARADSRLRRHAPICPETLADRANNALHKRRRGKDLGHFTFIDDSYQLQVTGSGRSTRSTHGYCFFLHFTSTRL